MAKATRVRNAAKNDIKDATSVIVIWVENDKSRAMKVTPVAIGWTTSP